MCADVSVAGVDVLLAVMHAQVELPLLFSGNICLDFFFSDIFLTFEQFFLLGV